MFMILYLPFTPSGIQSFKGIENSGFPSGNDDKRPENTFSGLINQLPVILTAFAEANPVAANWQCQ
jgi:hypothetical protein